MIWDTAEAFTHALCYVILSGAILGFGYLTSDILTPGALGEKAKHLLNGNPNVAIMTAAHLVSSGVILLASVWVTHQELGKGLLMTGTFGVLGVALLAVIELLVVRVTPAALTDGGVQERLYGETFHPLSAVVATISVVFGLIIAVSIL